MIIMEKEIICQKLYPIWIYIVLISTFLRKRYTRDDVYGSQSKAVVCDSDRWMIDCAWNVDGNRKMISLFSLLHYNFSDGLEEK